MAAAGRVVVAVTGALTTILIARLLGPEGSGTFYLAQSVVLLLTVAASLGVEHGIAFYVANGSWSPRSALVSSLRFATVTGVIGAAIGVAARLVVPEAFAGLDLWMTVVTVVGLPFGLGWFYATFVALASDRYEAYVLPPALQSTLMMVLGGAGAIAFGVGGAVAGMTLATVAVGIGAAAWGLRRLPRQSSPQPPRQLRRAVSFGIKGYAANALQMVNYRLDLFILSSVATAAAVGHYAVAIAVTSVLWLLPQALADVVFPRVAHLSGQAGADAEAHREMVETKSLRHVVIAVVAVAAVLAAALLFLVVPIYGAAFRPAIELGLIRLPGAVAIGIGSVLSSTIVGRGRPVYSLYTALVTTPVTVVLYLTLIPALDATGAALASSLSFLLSFAITAAFYRRTTGRAVLPLLVPTRSELHDLLRLPSAALEWARGIRS